MIKRIIKSIFGRDAINKFKGYKNYLYSLFKRGKVIKILSNDVVEVYPIRRCNSHVFCGYFDIHPDNPYNNDEIIAGIIPKNAVCGKSEMSIAIINYKKNIIKKITNTRAWSWQMGARLRWSSNKNIIIYNDYVDGKYCTMFFDIEKKQVVKKIDYPLYDICKNENFGLSVNFSRLQRLRPGYGYSNIEDNTVGKTAPFDDGLFYVDIENNTAELYVSLEELSKKIPESKGKESYINHVSISPSGSLAMFFYIWKTDIKPGWKATLWIIDLKSKELRCLEKDDQVSHYAWKNDNNLLITGIDHKTNCGFYRNYNVNNGKYIDIDDNNLKTDGHPAYSRCFNGFYGDTYPDKKFKQIFFKYENDEYKKLISLYHNPLMSGEKRCDLHPHYFCNDELVALDTTYRGFKRQILIVRLKNE